MSSVIVSLAFYLVVLGLNPSARLGLNEYLVWMLLLPYIGHIGNRWLAPEADPSILPISTMLNGLGFVMIFRLSPPQAHLQAIWSTVGVATYIGALVIVKQSDLLDRYRYLLAAGGIGLLLLPLVPVIGENINGARLWIHLGPMSFQPVEIAKLALAVFFASYLSEKRDLLASFSLSRRAGTKDLMRTSGPLVAAWAVSILVMTAERDIGFSLLIFLTFMVVLWLATSNKTYLVTGGVLFGAGAFIASKVFGQVSERMIIWLDPWKYSQTIGYQLVQAQYAMGSGGLTGTGLGRGHPSLIPVVTSDFIFAAIGEELGLLGTTAVVFAFLLLIGAGLRAAQRARSEFSTLTATSFTLILGLQSFFIMAGIVRLLPLTGVTLPFVAYGGSSIVANYALVAILNRISDEGNSTSQQLLSTSRASRSRN